MGLLNFFRKPKRRVYYYDDYGYDYTRYNKSVPKTAVNPPRNVNTPPNNVPVNEPSKVNTQPVYSTERANVSGANDVINKAANKQEAPGEIKREVKSYAGTVDPKKSKPILKDVQRTMEYPYDVYQATGLASFFTPPPKPKKDVIIFAIENTPMVVEHKDKILNLIKKIANDNEKCFFMFLRMGNNKKYFDILNYESIQKDNIFDTLFIGDDEEKANVDYQEVLKHINDFLISTIVDLEYKNKKYEIQNYNIIFIGTGEYEDVEVTKSESLNLMKRITSRSKVKTVKYFCINDNQTINVAALGFSVIGHIVTDFYQ